MSRTGHIGAIAAAGVGWAKSGAVVEMHRSLAGIRFAEQNGFCTQDDIGGDFGGSKTRRSAHRGGGRVVAEGDGICVGCPGGSKTRRYAGGCKK